MGRNMKTSYSIRSMAALYLLYCAYSLIRGFVDGSASWVFLLVGILFGGFGLFVLIQSMTGLRKIMKEEKMISAGQGERKNDQGEKEEAEEK